MTAARNCTVTNPHSGETRCVHCGRVGHLWAGTDELGQQSALHWPHGWQYNHTIYGYGGGSGCMCPECWAERQQPDWAMQPQLFEMG